MPRFSRSLVAPDNWGFSRPVALGISGGRSTVACVTFGNPPHYLPRTEKNVNKSYFL